MRLLLFFILSVSLITLSSPTSLQRQGGFNYLKPATEGGQYGNEGNQKGNQAITLTHEPEWDYGCGSDIGPSEWGELSQEWSLCSTGAEQSPIKILSFNVAKSEQMANMETMHHPAPATVVNDGNLIRLKWKGGFVYIDGILYELHETLFHTPSEHTINGKIYPLEMQMMHKSRKDGGMVILSILFKLDDKENKFLDQFWPYIPSFEWNQAVDITGGVDPKELHLNRKQFYQYRGSLTTPPCTEGVIWMVMKKIHKVSPMQVDILYDALKHENSRPTQALNGRTVYKGK